MKFNYFWPPPGKIHYCSLPETSFRCPSLFMYRSGFLNLFCTCLNIHQIYHFATPHPCWYENKIIQIRQ